MLCLGLATVPLVAGVHRLPAGLPTACSLIQHLTAKVVPMLRDSHKAKSDLLHSTSLEYLLSVIMTLRQEQSSLLRAALANLILPSDCLSALAPRCCNPFLLRSLVTLLGLLHTIAY